eukprot:CAMPEP_0178993732 /NCGR_PEP_ID=MMETSP0795-20121207/6871_1 /TAXON_ID=88552 /ORGANISM="Amoebophrya sp., Strain Ameob2" /LENGTH=312 /DNA_ID=CAMNT_0020685833 /DNA_START=271 /DNA_END=1206 /DNA_ORIENTATION=-
MAAKKAEPRQPAAGAPTSSSTTTSLRMRSHSRASEVETETGLHSNSKLHRTAKAASRAQFGKHDADDEPLETSKGIHVHLDRDLLKKRTTHDRITPQEWTLLMVLISVLAFAACFTGFVARNPRDQNARRFFEQYEQERSRRGGFPDIPESGRESALTSLQRFFTKEPGKPGSHVRLAWQKVQTDERLIDADYSPEQKEEQLLPAPRDGRSAMLKTAEHDGEKVKDTVEFAVDRRGNIITSTKAGAVNLPFRPEHVAQFDSHTTTSTAGSAGDAVRGHYPDVEAFTNDGLTVGRSGAGAVRKPIQESTRIDW